VEALARIFQSDNRPTRILLGADASEPEIEHLANSGQLGRFGFIHLATNCVIDEEIPVRSAIILTQAGLPDPLEQFLHQRPVFDGRLSVLEIQRGWDLKAEMVTLWACETALGRDAGGEGFVGFTQALLMCGTRSVCLPLWNVDDWATLLLMRRFYENLLGKRVDLARPLSKAEALAEAKNWLRCLNALQAEHALEDVGSAPVAEQRGKPNANADHWRPYEHPFYWAAFVLVGDPD
jgi:CHAT domain-containing protein